MGTGGCAAFDVVLILKKSRQDISDCVVEIEAERALRNPRYSPAFISILSDRKKTETRAGGASDQAIRGKILLGLDNAGKNGGIDTRL